MGYKEQLRHIIVQKTSDGTLRNVVAGTLSGTVKASVELNKYAKKTYDEFAHNKKSKE